MRLITKFTVLYLLVSAFIFTIGINISIYLFIKEVGDEVDYQLREDLQYLSNSIKKGVEPEMLISDNKNIKVLTLKSSRKAQTRFSDTVAYNSAQGKMMQQRKLLATKKINDTYYEFILLDTLVEPSDAYLQSIKSLGSIFVLLLVVMGISSFFISKWMFRPFKTTLKKINDFDLQHRPKALQFETVKTKEFQQLNSFLAQMTQKIVTDYQALKEFTENASHEMQTPIAVAKGKLELLANSKNIKKDDSILIDDIFKALTKVSNLERTLSLLFKLDNEEFPSTESVNISQSIKNLLVGFEELVNLKSLELTEEIEKDVFVNANPDLLKIMLSNLIKNAIQHNVKNGYINITLTDKTLTIKNSGKNLQSNPETLFNRFKKDNQSSGSLGLGLAIIKKICDFHDFGVEYKLKKEEHFLIIKFIN